MENLTIKETWKRVLEYASSPLPGTSSRKQREGIKICFNNGVLHENSILNINKDFIIIKKMQEEREKLIFIINGIV